MKNYTKIWREYLNEETGAIDYEAESSVEGPPGSEAEIGSAFVRNMKSKLNFTRLYNSAKRKSYIYMDKYISKVVSKPRDFINMANTSSGIRWKFADNQIIWDGFKHTAIEKIGGSNVYGLVKIDLKNKTVFLSGFINSEMYLNMIDDFFEQFHSQVLIDYYRLLPDSGRSLPEEDFIKSFSKAVTTCVGILMSATLVHELTHLVSWINSLNALSTSEISQTDIDKLFGNNKSRVVRQIYRTERENLAWAIEERFASITYSEERIDIYNQVKELFPQNFADEFMEFVEEKFDREFALAIGARQHTHEKAWKGRMEKIDKTSAETVYAMHLWVTRKLRGNLQRREDYYTFPAGELSLFKDGQERSAALKAWKFILAMEPSIKKLKFGDPEWAQSMTIKNNVTNKKRIEKTLYGLGFENEEIKWLTRRELELDPTYSPEEWVWRNDLEYIFEERGVEYSDDEMIKLYQQDLQDRIDQL